MSILETHVPKRSWLAAHLTELSPAARRRLKWIDYYVTQGRNARRTCRHFDISPQTFYRGWRRYTPQDLTSLDTRSRARRRRRRPTWSPALVAAVRDLRCRYPRWGKDKLVVLLHRAGWTVSTSMVGAYAVRRPGDLVQIDTLDVRPFPGVGLKPFTGRDLISRWDVVEVFPVATARTAAAFLDVRQARMPFPVHAVQVEGGAEFFAEFERAGQHRGIRLFVLPPRSPKLNGHVERAQRTHTEEFYEVTDREWTVPAVNRQLRQWERIYNTVRPHQSLGYRTPDEFLRHFARAG